MSDDGGSNPEPRTIGDANRATAVVSDGLADRRRREALSVLFAFSTPITLPTVADFVTELECGTPAEEYPEERLRIYMSLYHDHVPILEEAGLVVYTQEGDVIDLGERADEIENHPAIAEYTEELRRYPTESRDAAEDD